MTIKNKDGSVYVLRGPNPIVKGQDFWQTTELIFHNFKWEDIIYSKSIQKNNEKIVVKEKIETTPLQEKMPITPYDVETKNQNEKQDCDNDNITNENLAYEMPLIKHKVLSYCLPAVVKNYKDNFYGESWSKIKYGKKFIFPFVMIENQDLFIQFWTSDPNKQITEKSIIYPFSYEIYNFNSSTYDRVPYDEYRWWQISKKEFKDGGWLFEATPSKDQPDFSDSD
jgi:hypothetical protein